MTDSADAQSRAPSRLSADESGAPTLTGDHTAALEMASLERIDAGPMANASLRQLVRNFASGYFSLAITVILSLILTPIVLRHLGQSNYGIWVAVTALGSYIGLLDAGVATAAVAQIASATALRNERRVAEILVAMRVFFALTGLAAVGVAALLMPFLAHIFHLPPGTLFAAKVGLLLMGVTTALGFLSSVSAAAFYGGGRSDRLAIIGVTGSLLVQGGQIIVALTGGGIIGLFLVSSVGALANLVASDYFARRSGLLMRTQLNVNWKLMRALVGLGARNTVVAIAGIISFNLDAVVIGTVLPVSKIAPYDLALSTANLARNVSTRGTNLLLPTYAHASALNDKERQFRLYSRAVSVSMAISIPVVAALVAAGPGLLRLWLGVVPDQTYEVLVALNVVLLLQLPGHQSFLFLTGIGRNKLLAQIAAPLAVANLLLSIAATFWLGPVGPAVGSFPQVLVVDFVVLPMICCRFTSQPFRRYAAEALLPLLAPLAASALVAAVLAWRFGGESGVVCVLVAVTTTVVGWAAFVPWALRSEPAIRGKALAFIARCGAAVAARLHR